MTRTERGFTLGVVALSLALPGLLLVAEPFAEARAPLGVAAGWGLALLVIVPSFLLMNRVMDCEDRQRFQRAFMGGTVGRFAVFMVGVMVFVLTVDQAPKRTFLLTFFLGYGTLAALELTLLLRKSPDGTHP